MRSLAVIDRVNDGARRVPVACVYIVGMLWAGWLFYQGLTGGLGPEPINALEREYGSVALKLLIFGLLVTPLRRWVGLNLLRFRRAIGVTAFFYVLAHFLVFVILDVQSLAVMWAEVVKRPYVTVGMVSLLMLIPLAVTSNNLAVRRLGAVRWRILHKLTYPAAILAGVHYFWLVKGFQIEPIIYMAAIIVLVTQRVKLMRWLPSRS